MPLLISGLQIRFSVTTDCKSAVAKISLVSCVLDCRQAGCVLRLFQPIHQSLAYASSAKAAVVV
jgi:hypothetical protein